jgi:hypothetical protein
MVHGEETGIRRQALSSTLSSDRREQVRRMSRREAINQPFLLLSSPTLQLSLSSPRARIVLMRFHVNKLHWPSPLGVSAPLPRIMFLDTIFYVRRNPHIV